jgi:predicted nucleic acid-binding protein
MLDTNILISAIVFRSKPMNGIINLLAEKYSLVLCSYIIDELHEVVDEKFGDKKNDLEKFLLELAFELVYTPQSLPKRDLFTISDVDDEKILYSAIIADVDVLVTGDKHYDEVDIERPEILSPAEYLAKH